MWLDPFLISIFKLMSNNYEEKSEGVQALGSFFFNFLHLIPNSGYLILESFRIVVEAEGPMDLVKGLIMKNDWSPL